MYDAKDFLMQPFIPVSVGELLDKLTILEIKLERIADEDRKKNIAAEYEALSNICGEAIFMDTTIQQLYSDLLDINTDLWEIEDSIRIKERDEEFDEEFINLARSVYYTNDRRSLA